MHNTQEARQYTQPELITLEPPISETCLVAVESPRIAFYRVAVFYLPGAGYRIEKSSGATGTQGIQEHYWRPTLKTAMHKKALLIAAKMRKRKGPRQYTKAGSSGIEED